MELFQRYTRVDKKASDVDKTLPPDAATRVPKRTE
jgi:hypothetical protein